MESKFFKYDAASSDWSGYTLVFSCVSVGNIGQLALDLLVATHIAQKRAERVGHLITPLLHPVVGQDPFVHDSPHLSLSCELYESAEAKVVFMQQRAPLVPGKRNEFARLLVEFVESERFADVIALTSSHAYERIDAQLTGAQCRFLATRAEDDAGNSNKTFPSSWKRLETRLDRNANDFLPGGGIAQKFFNLCKEKSLDATVLVVFAHEGNNLPESFQLVDYLNEWKNYIKTPSDQKQQQVAWKVPASWTHLFGQSIDPSVQHRIF